MKYIIFIVLLVLGLGYAGQSDYEDGVIVEMKNNGELKKSSTLKKQQNS